MLPPLDQNASNNQCRHFKMEDEIMEMKKQTRDAGNKKLRQFQEAKKKADQSIPHGIQPHDIAERGNMKRQKKQMHEQDNK